MSSTYKQISFLFSNLFNGLFHFITLLYWLGPRGKKTVWKWLNEDLVLFLILTVGDIYYISTLSLMLILAVEVHKFFNKVGKLLLCKVLSISPNIFLQGNYARFSFSLTMLLWSVRHIPDIKSSWISRLNLSWTWYIMYFTYQWRLLIFPLEYLCLCL